jgi:hypothetical protein
MTIVARKNTAQGKPSYAEPSKLLEHRCQYYCDAC